MITVAIVDDHHAIRLGLRAALRRPRCAGGARRGGRLAPRSPPRGAPRPRRPRGAAHPRSPRSRVPSRARPAPAPPRAPAMITVAIVDDHHAIRLGLRAALL